MIKMQLQLFASPETGVKGLVYAVMLDETLETYGAVKPAIGLMNMKISPKSDTAKLPGDNKIMAVATSVGDIAVDFEAWDMPMSVQADFFGHVLDAATGIMEYNVNDVSPYLAVGYQRTKLDGTNRYVWLRKIKFEEISEESKTAEPGKTSFQTPKVVGTAIANKDGKWKIVADETTKGSPIVGFLSTAPGMTATDLIAPTATSVPIDAATGVIGTANLVLTFNKAIMAATAIASNIFVIKADGTAVPTLITIDTAKLVVTVDPVATLTTGAYILVATTGVKSASGVALTDNYVVNFTV